MSSAPRALDERAGLASVAQALLALLPAIVLAWPLGGPLAHDFAPRTSGFGLAALAAIPGAVLCLLRGAAPSVRGSLLLAVPLLVSTAWLAFGAPTDPFEAARATLSWALILASFLLGAASDPRTLARVAVGVALCAAGGAFSAPHAGPFGNAGSTSEAATLGAGAALVLLVTERWPARLLALLSLAAFLNQALSAPVLAGGVALAVAAVAVAATAEPRRRPAAILAAVAALIAVAAPFWIARGEASAPANVAAASAATPPTAVTAPPSPAGGLAVRAALHAASARLLAAHPLWGVGPGQFAAAFPPFRELAEIEASSHGRLQAAETEVEHAHDDWIQPALELGIPAGLAWIAFLLVVLRASWSALRSGDAPRAALGAGLVALLVHALARAPVSANAASATLFAAAAGALLARRDAPAPTLARRVSVIAALVVLLACAPRAWAFVRHGWALRALAADTRADPEGRERAIAQAAAVAPDSVLVRTLEARLAEAFGEPPARVVVRWDSVLALRPHRVEALVQKASAAARAGQRPTARATLEQALELDAGNPPALTNLAALELLDGETAAGLARLDRIPAARMPERDWLRGLAARLSLAGLDEASVAVTSRCEPERAALSPAESYALSRELRAGGEDLPADGFEARAHRAWAAEHAHAARWSECVRSMRQALRLSEERPGGGSAVVRLALAAALHRAGRGDEARAELAAVDPGPAARARAALPDWAQGALAELEGR
ncbi:MAG: O-antigen ligase family protein [Planctomycetes bacterium]|nr:O-antigen ligase family protein [Planctomycetota bacterium]